MGKRSDGAWGDLDTSSGVSSPVAHEACHCFPARDLLTTAASPLLVFCSLWGTQIYKEQSSQAYHSGSALGSLAMARVVSLKGDTASLSSPIPVEHRTLWSSVQIGEPSYSSIPEGCSLCCSEEQLSASSVATF